MVDLVDGPIDVAQVMAAVRDPSRGAVLLFLGTTRDTFEGAAVLGLRYEAHEALARADLRRICVEVEGRHGARCAIVHRLGEVGVGGISVAIAVAAAHRDAAYAASREAIEALKATVPIWKLEKTDDGNRWKANPPGHGG